MKIESKHLISALPLGSSPLYGDLNLFRFGIAQDECIDFPPSTIFYTHRVRTATPWSLRHRCSSHPSGWTQLSLVAAFARAASLVHPKTLGQLNLGSTIVDICDYCRGV